MKLARILSCLMAVGLGIAACSAAGPTRPQATATPYRVTFNAQIDAKPDGTTLMTLSVHNAGPEAMPQGAFQEHWELRTSDGELLAKAEGDLPAIPPTKGETPHQVLTWESKLDAGSYTMTWGAAGLGSTVVQFELVKKGDRLRLDREILVPVEPGSPGSDSPLGS